MLIGLIVILGFMIALLVLWVDSLIKAIAPIYRRIHERREEERRKKRLARFQAKSDKKVGG